MGGREDSKAREAAMAFARTARVSTKQARSSKWRNKQVEPNKSHYVQSMGNVSIRSSRKLGGG